MKPIARCVLFDLDGTLVDTAPDLGGAANDLLAELDRPPLPLVAYRPESSHGARGMLKLALGIDPDHPDFPRHRERYLALYRARLSRHTRPFPGIDAVLDRIEAYGLRWGVVTNKPLWLAQPLMDDLGLSARSACLIGGDSTPHPKPAPDPILAACRRIGAAPAEGLYVGDDQRDVQAGRAAGTLTAVARWGYLGADARPRDWGADAVLDAPEDLIDLIEPRHAA